MEYIDRITIRKKLDDLTFYLPKTTNIELITDRLGEYEDLGFTPRELAAELIKYEKEKDCTKWDLDKIEKWQRIYEHQTIEDKERELKKEKGL